MADGADRHGEGSVHELVGEGLTAWSVSPGGERVRLGFEDGDGNRCELDLPFEAVSALLMTIPSILRAALGARGDRCARVVQPLRSWRLEQAVGSGSLILTLSTPTGFEIAFVVAQHQLEGMGEAAAESGRTGILLN
ncbi:MAG: hypothetical protein JOZ58_23840 [Acetobacteraceae bacterium]|nr:hypothetical protein [Acetobacteraceae bacterium]